MEWTVIIPVKALPAAKSRLAAASADPAAHRRLVEAIRSDTIAAVRASQVVARVLIVTDSPDSADGSPDSAYGSPDSAYGGALVQSAPGLNAAVREGMAHAATTWPADGVAALVGDLPALRPEELTAALTAAAGHAVSFVTDAEGVGTTLLAGRPGHTPQPAFGTGSAARHARDAVAVPAGPGLRQDVDTAADLDLAADLGLGPATSAVLGDAAVPRRSTCSGIVGS